LCVAAGRGASDYLDHARADIVSLIRTAQTIEAMPQRTGARRGSKAAEPITERIRRRMGTTLTA
jgi:hypothetical protein